MRHLHLHLHQKSGSGRQGPTEQAWNALSILPSQSSQAANNAPASHPPLSFSPPTSPHHPIQPPVTTTTDVDTRSAIFSYRSLHHISVLATSCLAASATIVHRLPANFCRRTPAAFHHLLDPRHPDVYDTNFISATIEANGLCLQVVKHFIEQEKAFFHTCAGRNRHPQGSGAPPSNDCRIIAAP